MTWLGLATPTLSSQKPRRYLYGLKCLRKFVRDFYQVATENPPTSCFITWYGSYTSQDHKTLGRVVPTAQSIIGCPVCRSCTSRAASKEGPEGHKGPYALSTVITVCTSYCLQRGGTGPIKYAPAILNTWLYAHFLVYQADCTLLFFM